MNTNKPNPSTLINPTRPGWLALVPIALLAACGGSGPQVRPTAQGFDLAYAPAMTDSTGSTRPATGKVSEEVLRDPQERTLLMQRLIQQIVRQTRNLDNARYHSQVRPDLDRRLREAGFHPEDVIFMLADVDRSRGGS